MIPSSQVDTAEKRHRWETYLQRYYHDRRWAIETHLKIRTKDQRLIYLQLNEAQDRLYKIVESQEAAGVPVRVIGVKPRKVGLSTGIQAIFFHRSSTRKLQKALTVAHDLDSTEEMFGITDLFYSELPEQLRPMKRYSGRGELVFENPDEESRQGRPGLRSQLRIGTAGKVDVGRSKDIHLLHCSESPYWPDVEKTELALLNAVPDLPSTYVFKEGTPNGVGTKFHRDYEDAKAGRSAYAPYFMAWWEFQEYRMAVTHPEAFLDTLDEEEVKVRQAYNLDLEQLNWRRWAIKNKCGGNDAKFEQEYPANDVDCFLVSGRPRFHVKKLHEMLLAVTDPVTVGLLITEGSRVKWQEQPQGFVRMWQPPKLAKRYVLGADVAEGLEGGDFSCGHVYTWDTAEMVAEWHGHIEPDLFGKELGKLGKIYNMALIGVEANKDGGTVNTRLKNDGYPHLFYRQNVERRTNHKTQSLGWLTTSTSKPQLIDTLAAAIIDGAHIPSRETISEMMTFVYHKDGSLGAQSGCFDDRVLGSGIALEIRKRYGLGSVYPGLAWQ